MIITVDLTVQRVLAFVRSRFICDIFNIYLEREWPTSCDSMGIPIDEFYLYNLNFTNDRVLFAQNAYGYGIFILKRLT